MVAMGSNSGVGGQARLEGVVENLLAPIKKDLDQVMGLAAPRRVEAIQMAAARDVGAWLLGQIPVVGDFLADALQDNMWANMRRRLTPQEIDTFTEVTRRYPDTLALALTFQRLP